LVENRAFAGLNAVKPLCNLSLKLPAKVAYRIRGCPQRTQIL